MAFLDQSIDINDIPASTNTYELLPPGWYDATISGAELRSTKTGGQMIACKYTITGPTHQGRVVWGNINIRNSNPKAEEIGRSELGNLMRAAGLVRVSDTDELIGAKMSIKLAIKESDGKYDARNEVKGYKSNSNINSQQPIASQPQASGTSVPPWLKK